MKKFMIAAGSTVLGCAWLAQAAYYPNCNGLMMNDGEDAVQPHTPCPSQDGYCIDYHYEDYCYKCVGGGPLTAIHCEIGFHAPINWTSYEGECNGGTCNGDPNLMIETQTDDNCDGGTNTDTDCNPGA